MAPPCPKDQQVHDCGVDSVGTISCANQGGGSAERKIRCGLENLSCLPSVPSSGCGSRELLGSSARQLDCHTHLEFWQSPEGLQSSERLTTLSRKGGCQSRAPPFSWPECGASSLFQVSLYFRILSLVGWLGWVSASPLTELTSSIVSVGTGMHGYSDSISSLWSCSTLPVALLTPLPLEMRSSLNGASRYLQYLPA